ncbi:MAG: hypothetical protein HQ507_10815 [Candidatus Marinimicrobia bacterium]|nr:hypothetical protein [Candidatus Neomarinimicrobiota bacterium]
MKFFKIILYCVCAGVLHGYETPGSLHFNISYGQTTQLYGESLQEFEQLIKNAYQDMDIPLEIVQSFPSSAMLRYELTRSFGKLQLGLFYANSATGGRLHYADYSGSAAVDHIMDNSYFGINIQHCLIQGAHVSVLQSNQLGMLRSSYETTEKIKIWDEETSEHYSFESTAYFIEPGLEINFVLLKFINIGAYVGPKLFIYALPYHLPDNKDDKLTSGYNKFVKPDWIEANVALKIGFSLGK